MTTTPLFTRNLFHYQREFHRRNSQDQTLNGMMMTHLAGRVISIGVTLILHAEAVCRAVAICFLSICDIFARTNEELLNIQKVECTKAYTGSLQSFCSLFNRDYLKEESRETNHINPQLEEELPMVHHNIAVGHPFIDEPDIIRREELANAPHPDVHEIVLVPGLEGLHDARNPEPLIAFALLQEADDAIIVNQEEHLDRLADMDNHDLDVLQLDQIHELADLANGERQAEREQLARIAEPLAPIPDALANPVNVFAPVAFVAMPEINEVELPVVLDQERMLAPLVQIDQHAVNVVEPNNLRQMPQLFGGAEQPAFIAVPLEAIALVDDLVEFQQEIVPIGPVENVVKNLIEDQHLLPRPEGLDRTSESASVIGSISEESFEQLQPLQALPHSNIEIAEAGIFGHSTQVPVLQMGNPESPQSQLSLWNDSDIPDIEDLRSRLGSEASQEHALVNEEAHLLQDDALFPAAEMPGEGSLLGMGPFIPEYAALDQSDDDNSVVNISLDRQILEVLEKATQNAAEGLVVVEMPAPYIPLGPSFTPTPRWVSFQNKTGIFKVGGCSYTHGKPGINILFNEISLEDEDQREMKAQICGLFVQKQLDIPGARGPQPPQNEVFQIFEKHFSRAFQEFFKTYSTSITGVWSSISTSVESLNAAFMREEGVLGASLTLAIIVNQRLWIASMGSTGALLSNNGEPIQCSILQLDSKKGFGFGEFGGPQITSYSLRDIQENSYLMLGSRKIFQRAGSQQLANWLAKNDVTQPLEKRARNIVNSVHQSQITKTPLGCVIIDLNHSEWDLVSENSRSSEGGAPWH